MVTVMRLRAAMQQLPGYWYALLLLWVVMWMQVSIVYADQAPVYDIDAAQAAGDDEALPATDSPTDAEVGDQAIERTTTESATPTRNQNAVQGVVQGEALSKQLTQVKQQVANLHLDDLWARLEGLQNELQSLRNQIEQINHQLVQLKDQHKAMYVEVDQRLLEQKAMLQALQHHHERYHADADVIAHEQHGEEDGGVSPADKEAGGDSLTDDSAAARSLTQPTPAQPNVLEEQHVYQTAYNLIKAKKYQEAAHSLQAMLEKYPTGQFAANAHYWLGELYGLMNQNELALAEFQVIAKRYPNSARIADAQLKIGLLYAAQSKWTLAQAAFKKVVNHYPGTTAARVALDQLKQIEHMNY